MYILGISCFYHDSSIALIKDGKLIFSVAEERYSRVKHDNSFPERALSRCLEYFSLKGNDIDAVVFYEKPLVKFERVLYQSIDSFPYSYKLFVKNIPSWLGEKLRITQIIKSKVKGYKKDVIFIPHHTSHAALAFLSSPFEDAAIVTIDGVGEWTTTSICMGEGNKIKPLKEVHFPHSLGLFYSTLTAYLGFMVNNSEYKVMGLSAYGVNDRRRNIFYKRLKKVLRFDRKGNFKLDMNYFDYLHSERMFSKKLCVLLGGNPRKKAGKITKRHKDIAAAMQMIYEDVLMSVLNYAHRITKKDAMVFGGGCALNSLANGKILDNTSYKKIWIPPDPGDGGCAAGSALYYYNSIRGNKRTFKLEHAYLGQSYKSLQIKAFLDKNEIVYKEFKDANELVAECAKRIFANEVVGWFQGKMEWGPRALGSRSILANPLNQDMKDILNSKVKHREEFRPFAPSVCEDDVQEYFVLPQKDLAPLEFMLMVVKVKEEYREMLPSISHVDGTARLQEVKKDKNPLFFSLIKEFGKLSQIPIIINTSFNVRGEPIVESPRDALNCFKNTGIDVLFLGPYMIEKSK